VGEVGEARDPCVVDQDVEAAEAPHGDVEGATPVLVAGDVGGDRDHVRVGGGQGGGQLGELVGGAGRQHHAGAGGSQLLGQAAADAAGGPGDQDAPAAEVALHAVRLPLAPVPAGGDANAQTSHLLQGPQATSSYQTR